MSVNVVIAVALFACRLNLVGDEIPDRTIHALCIYLLDRADTRPPFKHVTSDQHIRGDGSRPLCLSSQVSPLRSISIDIDNPYEKYQIGSSRSVVRCVASLAVGVIPDRYRSHTKGVLAIMDVDSLRAGVHCHIPTLAIYIGQDR